MAVALLSVACEGGGSPTAPAARTAACGPFEPWESSEFVLPYPVGAVWVVGQGNCSTDGGHRGFWRYGYDFAQPIGTTVTAVRDGVVVHSEGAGVDGDTRVTNLVTVEHADGTVAVYSHLTHGGALVATGERVRAGDPVGLVGNTGNTGGTPHLHFSVHPCAELPGVPGGDSVSCPSLPVTFRNTDPNPEGLVAGRAYPALPYDG